MPMNPNDPIFGGLVSYTYGIGPELPTPNEPEKDPQAQTKSQIAQALSHFLLPTAMVALRTLLYPIFLYIAGGGLTLNESMLAGVILGLFFLQCLDYFVAGLRAGVSEGGYTNSPALKRILAFAGFVGRIAVTGAGLALFALHSNAIGGSFVKLGILTAKVTAFDLVLMGIAVLVLQALEPVIFKNRIKIHKAILASNLLVLPFAAQVLARALPDFIQSNIEVAETPSLVLPKFDATQQQLAAAPSPSSEANEDRKKELMAEAKNLVRQYADFLVSQRVLFAYGIALNPERIIIYTPNSQTQERVKNMLPNKWDFKGKSLPVAVEVDEELFR